MTMSRRIMISSAAGLSLASMTPRLTTARTLETAGPKSMGFDPERLKRIPAALQRRVDAGEAPGFVAAVMREGKIVQVDTLGYRDIAARTPMSRDTIFRIMSMTKPIVSVAAMILAEENRLRLTDPVAKFIPAFADQKIYLGGEGDKIETSPAKRQVQVRNLLTHTSGYSYGLSAFPALVKLYRAVLPRDKSLAEFCAAAATLPLQFEPGTQWQYGISTDILGHVVELASGRTLPEFLQDRIFGPLGMVDTAFFVAPEKRARFTNCYTRKDGVLAVFDDAKTSRFLSAPVMYSGGGGLTSTADDYLRFAAMLLNEGQLDGVRILGPETVRMMRANHLPKAIMDTRDSGFGLGFGVDLAPVSRDYFGGAGAYHWSGANRTHFWVDPANKIVGLSLTQMEPFDNYFEEDMRALVYQAFMG